MILIYLDKKNIFFCFVETSFLIHATAQQNKLNMWHRKQSMQTQTDEMIWLEKLWYQKDETGMSPPNCIALSKCDENTLSYLNLILHCIVD